MVEIFRAHMLQQDQAHHGEMPRMLGGILVSARGGHEALPEDVLQLVEFSQKDELPAQPRIG